jgi:metallo-beta-lactamase class B
MALLLVFVVTQATAQEQLPPGVTAADLAKNNKLFIELATKALHWDEPTVPIKIVGP